MVFYLFSLTMTRSYSIISSSSESSLPVNDSKKVGGLPEFLKLKLHNFVMFYLFSLPVIQLYSTTIPHTCDGFRLTGFEFF